MIRHTLFILMFLLLALESKGQDFTNLATQSMQRREYRKALDFSKKAWDRDSNQFVGYLLYSSYLGLYELDSAVLFAKKAVYDSNINSNRTYSSRAKSSMIGLIEFCERNKNKSSLYRRIPYVRFVMNDDEAGGVSKNLYAIQAELLGSSPDKYVALLKDLGVSDSIITKLEQSEEFRTNNPDDLARVFLGIGAENTKALILETDFNPAEQSTIEITWKDPDLSIEQWDSSLDSIYSFDDKNQSHRLTYSEFYYPELFLQKELVIKSLLKVYLSYRLGDLDGGNSYIKKFGLYEKNIPAFYATIIPDMPQNIDSLRELIETYNW